MHSHSQAKPKPDTNDIHSIYQSQATNMYALHVCSAVFAKVVVAIVVVVAIRHSTLSIHKYTTHKRRFGTKNDHVFGMKICEVNITHAGKHSKLHIMYHQNDIVLVFSALITNGKAN